MKNLFDVKGKVIVITGGAGILGKGMAEYMAEQGCKVVVLDRADAGVAMCEEIKAKGGEALYLNTNVLDKAALEQNAKDIVATFGRIDILVNAAGGNMA
ncbi:MAG: SDR family NAD(P)-dependent oxidoreductase, partial [Paludibacter sp.]